MFVELVAERRAMSGFPEEIVVGPVSIERSASLPEPDFPAEDARLWFVVQTT